MYHGFGTVDELVVSGLDGTRCDEGGDTVTLKKTFLPGKITDGYK